jgi:hypothetical protein
MIPLAAVLLSLQDRLVHEPKAGDAIAVRDALTMTLKGTMTVGGNEEEFEQEVKRSRKAEVRVVAVDGGAAAKKELKVEEDVELQRFPPEKEFERAETALHGKTVTLSTKDGKLVAEGAPEAAKRGLRLEEDFPKLLPGKAVAVGDSWEVADADPTGRLVTRVDSAKIKATLKEFKEVDGRRCAVIAASIELKGKSPNDSDLAYTLESEWVVRVDRGVPLSMTAKGTVTLSRDADGIKVEAKGSVAYEAGWTLR